MDLFSARDRVMRQTQSMNLDVIKKFQFDYASYTEIYANGKMRLVSSDTELFQCYYEHPGIFLNTSSTESDFDLKQERFYFLDFLKKPTPATLQVMKALEERGYRHSVLKIEHDVRGFIKAYGFASKTNDIEINNNYLNNLNEIDLLTKQIGREVYKGYKHFNKLPENGEVCDEPRMLEKVPCKLIFSPSLNLTDRQKQVVELLFSGFKNHEIAQYLNISLRGAENHLTAIKNKFWCDKKEEIIYYLLKNKKVAVR